MSEAAARRVYLPPGPSRRIIPRWVGPVLAVGVGLAVVAAFAGAYWDLYQVQREVASLSRERDELRQGNAVLREEIRLLRTPAYIERLAREQLGMVKPGEIAIMLVRPTPAPADPSPGAGGGAGPRKPWWLRLLGR